MSYTFLTFFFSFFGKVLHYSSKLHKKAKMCNTLWKIKNATKYSSYLFFFSKIKQQEKWGFATSFCLVCRVIIKKKKKKWAGPARGNKPPQTLHSWFVTSVCTRRLPTTWKQEFKFFIDALSLQHLDLEGTWSTKFKAFNKNTTNPC